MILRLVLTLLIYLRSGNSCSPPILSTPSGSGSQNIPSPNDYVDETPLSPNLLAPVIASAPSLSLSTASPSFSYIRSPLALAALRKGGSPNPFETPSSAPLLPLFPSQSGSPLNKVHAAPPDFKRALQPLLAPLEIVGRKLRGWQRFAFEMDCSPPLPWTFCDPFCGVDDQAVDAETALDNAVNDIADAVVDAFQRAHLPLPRRDAISLNYTPTSLLLENFGDAWDSHNERYRSNAGAVAIRLHKNDAGKEPFNVKMEAVVSYDVGISEPLLKRVASELLQHLALKKGVRFKNTINVKELNENGPEYGKKAQIDNIFFVL